MFTLPDDKPATATAAPVDAKGKPARIDGAPSWSSSDENIVKVLAVNEDGSCQFAAGDLVDVTLPAVAQLRVDVDADLGEGVKPVTGLLDVEVVGGEAVSVGVNASLNS